MDVARYARNNSVLQYIPLDDFSKLIPHMQIREVDAKEVLHQAGEPVRFIYFPITALMSMLMPTSDGSTVELTMVGREGFTGMSALLNNVATREHGALTKVMTVIPGSVVRMKSEAFITAADSSLSVARSLHRYLSLLFIELALSVTCNRLHSLEQRCARWLLTAMDKSGTTEIPVTQEMLAGILGVYRQSIVQVLNDFETAGLIQRGRGAIRVETRERLVAIVCECYLIGRKRTLGRQAGT
ncbi:MAG: hypothetical protein OJF51_002667 [Nitrospira sp.]|nr:MAG: hypothetical protein OJF51_002667 [Nitrospira sp.]